MTPAEQDGFIDSLESEPPQLMQQGWHRTDFCSIWAGPDIDLIVLQAAGPSEAWDWSARGWREPDGWKREVSREKAEQAALKFYLEKE